jgi:hypothetical protein
VTLSQNSTAGLLVQRIVGRQNLLGRTAPRLRDAGRVPLGTFSRGRHNIRWGFTVGGRDLQPGCYLVTFRALTGGGRIRDLSTPYTVRITARSAPLVRGGIRLQACEQPSGARA